MVFTDFIVASPHLLYFLRSQLHSADLFVLTDYSEQTGLKTHYILKQWLLLIKKVVKTLFCFYLKMLKDLLFFILN